LARFRNDTGSVLSSQEFGLIPPGEFDAPGYDPEVHGVIPGCTWLDAPEPEGDESNPPPAGESTPPAGTPKAAKRPAKDKETA
jgi:hypothetical protein